MFVFDKYWVNFAKLFSIKFDKLFNHISPNQDIFSSQPQSWWRRKPKSDCYQFTRRVYFPHSVFLVKCIFHEYNSTSKSKSDCYQFIHRVYFPRSVFSTKCIFSKCIFHECNSTSKPESDCFTNLSGECIFHKGPFSYWPNWALERNCSSSYTKGKTFL